MDEKYIHGTEPEEQARLTAMNEMLNPTSVGMMRLRGAGSILDVGCGVGQLTRAMARAAGSGTRVMGVEVRREQIEAALEQAKQSGEGNLVEFREGSAYELPLVEGEWGGFDVVHSRFMLEHLSDPGAAVREMVRATRPGGRIILEDDDHANMRLWPEPTGWDLLWNAYVQSYFKLGTDPFVGRRLISLMHEAGAVPMRNSSLSVSSCSGSPAFQPLLKIVKVFLSGARETMIEMGLLSDDQFQSGLASLEAWGREKNSALWYITCWAEGKRPAGGADS